MNRSYMRAFSPNVFSQDQENIVMTMKSPRRLLLVVVATAMSLSFTSAAHCAMVFEIDQPLANASFGPAATGQTFTPNVGILPDPGTVSTLDLTAFSLFRGGSGASAASATTFLNIYDGDPGSGGTFVGSSSNSINTVGIGSGTEMAWTFDNLTLDYTIEYWAVMSSTSSAGTLDIGVSLQINGPLSVYAGGAGLIAGQVKASGDRDTRFNATFENSPSSSPEPSTFVLATLGLVGLCTGRRRKRS